MAEAIEILMEKCTQLMQKLVGLTTVADDQPQPAGGPE